MMREDRLPTRHRRNWRGKLILQVAETRHHMLDLNGSGYFDEWDTTVWRDAKLSDLYPEIAP